VKFIEKIKKLKIDQIDYYKEDVGIAFRSDGNLYFAKSMEIEFWTCIASKPTIAGFGGIDVSTIYFSTFPDGYLGKVLNKLFDIETKEATPFNTEIPVNAQIRGVNLVKSNLFYVNARFENDDFRKIILNSLTNSWKLLEVNDGTGLNYVSDSFLYYPLGGKQCSLIAYNLNTFEPLWKTNLESYSRYKENLNDTVYIPGRLSDFIGLFGNELILLVTNQILLAVDITTGVVTWNSEPLTNYFPSFGYKFNAETQQYSFLENHNKQYNIQAIKEAGTLIHTPLWLSSFMTGDTESGYIYAVVERHILEMNVATKSITVTEIASLLPFPKHSRFYRIYYSKGLLYISLSVDTIMPGVLTVYNPATKQFVFTHEFKDAVMDILFFGNKFYVLGYDGDLYEFER
jgi:hypothetical protein